MEKLLYLMGRKDGLSRAEFGSYYLQVHSLLGARLCVLMAGYTVNLTDEVDPGPGGPDSITEVWTPDAEGFMDPARGFRNAEEMMEVVVDDQRFIGTHLAWVVEEKLLFGDGPGGELRSRTPGAKRVSLHPRYSGPPASRGVTRVVEQRVRKVLTPGAPLVEVFVSEWAPAADAFAPVDGPAWVVSEYRQLDPGLSAGGRRT